MEGKLFWWEEERERVNGTKEGVGTMIEAAAESYNPTKPH